MPNRTEKTFLIVGATSDIGTALCQALAREKAHCILLDKASDALDKLYDDLLALGAASVLQCPLDRLTATPDQYREIAAYIGQNYNGLDGILFSEGAFTALTPLEVYDEIKWLAVLQINLNASFLLCKTMLPNLKCVPSAKIIFTHGIAANKSKAYWGAHAVSEAAISGLVDVINDELAPHISAKILAPGPVRCQQRLRAFPVENPTPLIEIDDLIQQYLALL